MNSNKWIKADILPPVNVDVLGIVKDKLDGVNYIEKIVYCIDDRFNLKEYLLSESILDNHDSEKMFRKSLVVTHWMPLPKFPEEE